MAKTAEPAQPYRVLARKYRPTDFTGLIGQEALVRTLSNAFATGRIAHAFMLTGVRGVGKTTTARILARAFNYEDETGRHPTLDLSKEGIHCRAIIEGHDLAELGKPGPRWDGADPATLERILFHLLQEYARHLGHLDVVAELADGQVGE